MIGNQRSISSVPRPPYPGPGPGRCPLLRHHQTLQQAHDACDAAGRLVPVEEIPRTAAPVQGDGYGGDRAVNRRPRRRVALRELVRVESCVHKWCESVWILTVESESKGGREVACMYVDGRHN